MNTTAGLIRDLEDELQRRAGRGAPYATLARETGLPLEIVRAMVHRAEDRLLGPRRERDRRVRRPTVALESFEERDLRRESRPMNNPPWVATEVLKRLDTAANNARQSTAPRECPICLRRFRPGRSDRSTCCTKCAGLALRIRDGDPRAELSVRMHFAPPMCAGCGEPLWAKRPDAKHCDASCVKRRQRKQWAAAQEQEGQ